ncbi:uncharacterized protein BX663DRAFT_522862 [Cokeromyces recurvatus]|uniref:uncharacterized protein n=1 Tax=Cokeromyces recurvatus TaxID=90255 RepID=UPI00221F2033|nr:uncharacterized protein BX663DRAFT_522862 [Cokeromyces recurvatus]KAI7899019.1 hypothetical protein BX663DRAFT_522862 [Cokeromyces recurvatus]
MNKPTKSILKYKPEANNSFPLQQQQQPQSWLSRLQSKLYNSNHSLHHDNNPLLLAKQDLKRVTFSVGNLTTEHCFFTDDSPRDESFEHQKQKGNMPTEEITPVRLVNHYEHACIQAEEGILERFQMILKHAKRNEDLQSINLSKQPITVHQANPLSSIFMLKFGLTSLNVSNCKLEDETVRILLSSLLVSNTIEHLNLSKNESIKMKGFKYIAIFIKQSKTIQSIDLSQCTIDKRSMEYLSQGLRYATNLRHVEMNKCALNSTVEAVFVKGISDNNSLISLSLCNIQSNHHHQWLSQLLTSQMKLERLDLSNNYQLHMSSLASSLIINHTLTHLCLSNCKINFEGLVHLSNALKENEYLKSLDLSNNPLGGETDEGIFALKSALLMHNSSLESLNLSATQLESSSVIALAEVLPENTVLTRLDLSKNPKIDIAGLLALSISIKMNHTLTFLDINIPPMDEELANLQNDIVAVCTTNMLQKVEQHCPSSRSSLQEEEFKVL